MDRYAVIGNPVAHSQSPRIHAEFARQTGQALTYTLLLAPLDGFAAAVREFAAAGGKGLNVTVPFKLQACELAERLSERARAAGAVNTLSFNLDCIDGDNTDGAGLVQDITGNLGYALAGKRVLLLGAGGAARGAMLPLLAERPADVVIANRTVARAALLAERFGGHGAVEAVGFSELRARQFDIVINATAASLTGDTLPLSAAAFAKGALAYDMMYGNPAAPFLQLASSAGADCADGLGMLVEQAAESFFFWRGVRPDTGPVLKLLRATA